MTLSERFWSKVDKSDAIGCWLWTGATSHGYGAIRIGGRKGRTVPAHRVAYELTKGLIPAGMDVLHRCDNPPCVRPSHLFLGTAKDNGQDMVSKGRDNPHNRGQVSCKHGHSLDDADFRNGRRHCRTCRVIRDSRRIMVNGVRRYRPRSGGSGP